MDYKVMDTELTSIANAIRTKGGTQAQLEFPTGFVTAIGDISGGGSSDAYIETQDGTLGVYIYDNATKAKIYWNGFTKVANDISIPSEISDIISSFPNAATYAYDSSKSNRIGSIGFYQGKMRSWDPSGNLLAGTFWGVMKCSLYLSAQNQQTPYEEPPRS